MKQILILTLIFLTIGGCAWLDKQFVPTYDEQGNEIARTPTATVQAVADSVPYGNLALNVILLVYGGIATYKKYKTEKGLTATVTAIKAASEDPALKDAVQKVKDSYLNPAQKSAGVLDLIKLVIAKV